MKCIKIFSITVVLSGLTIISSAQTLQDVVDARNKGSELMAAKDYDGAIAELEKCVELAKKVGGDDAEDHQIVAESALPDLYLKKAKNFSDAKDYQGALKALEATIVAAEKYKNADIKEKAEKAISPIYYTMGAADYSAKNYAEAIKNMDLAIARDQGMTNAYFIKGVCYESLRDEQNMVETYKKTIEVANAKGDASTAQKAQTQLTRFYFNAGVTAQKAQKWDDAIAAFSKTVEFDNTNADAFYSLAACYNSKKSWDNAISSAEKALELRSAGDGKNLDGIYYQLGTAYAGKNNQAKACENFKKVGEGTFLAGAKYQIEHALKCQ